MATTNAQNALLALKSRIPFFETLSNEDVLAITEDTNFVQNMTSGTQIFEQGDLSKELYFVVKGAVDIEIKSGKDNQYIKVATLKKKALIGEMAFITGESRSARAVVGENETSILSFKILEIPDEKTIFTLANIYLYFAKDMAEKLKNTSAKYAQAASVSDIPYEKIVAFFTKNHDSIIENSNNKHVLNITKDLLDEVEKFLTNQKNLDTKKEILRTAIIEAFTLKEKDVIIFAKDKIVIRIFQELEIPIAQQKDNKLQELKSKSSEKELTEEEELDKFLTTLFSVNAFFEQEVLQCSQKEDIEEYIREQAFEIINNTPAKISLNFRYLKKYNELSYAPAAKELEKFLWEDAQAYLAEELEASDSEIDEVCNDEKNIAFIKTISQRYIKKYVLEFNKVIADTFISAIAESVTADSVSDAITEAITGNNSIYVPILIGKDGRAVASRVNQVWMRASQASKIKQKELIAAREEVEKQTKLLAGIEKNIKTMHKTSKMTLADVEYLDHDKLRDLTINEGGEFNEDKRIVQFLPSGDITLALLERAEKGLINARSEIGKEEYKRTIKYISMIHGNNTKSNLEAKLQELYQEKPIRRERLQKAQAVLDEKEKVGLETFDEQLMKVKKTIVPNIGKKVT